MFAAYGHGSLCLRCAFRQRLLTLQARRNGHAQPETRSFEPDRPSLIRYHGSGQDAPASSTRREEAAYGFSVRRPFFRASNGRIARGHEARVPFSDALPDSLAALKHELRDAPILESIRKEQRRDGRKSKSFSRLWQEFEQSTLGERSGFQSVMQGSGGREGSRVHSIPVRQGLNQAYSRGGTRLLDQRIKYAFYEYFVGSRFTDSDVRNQLALADLRYPSEWFPATRSTPRTIHLHVGPTNSGKTYHALQRLEQAETGVYAGPLRLLAHEVYTRMNAKGKPCALITGEERRNPTEERKPGDISLAACTVEMMPLQKKLDVAVIDEIQMIGNHERGWAWTQALLGVRATEVHLCGEERTVPLIKELCASIGDKVVIHQYKRLSPLNLAEESLNGDLRRLRKGDCIVSFSVIGIHALRRQIEQQTGKKVATVYGSLPPETRAQQARLFNDPNNDYDYLVASDAVGMGLNLAIKRMIFETSSKFDGYQRRTLAVADIKQIAGRAGRYRTAHQATQEPTSDQDLAAAKGDVLAQPVVDNTNENVGLVTTLDAFDFPIVQAAMAAEPEPIRTAGLFPPAPVLERFASYFPPGTPFSYIITRLHELSQVHSRFHLCGLKEQVWIADMIEPVQGLTVTDRNIICSAPASMTEDLWKTLMPAYARCIAEQTGGNIVDIKELPLEVLERETSASREYLRELERLHKGIVTYLWLSYRFAGIFTTRPLAFHVKGLVEEKIEEVLSKFSFTESQRRKIAAQRQKQVLLDLQEMTYQSENATEAGRQHESEERTSPEEDLVAPADPDQQTSLTLGGDRFSGEEDIVLEDPSDSEQLEVDEGNDVLSRSRRSPGSPASHSSAMDNLNDDEMDDDVTEGPIAEAFHVGHDKGLDAAAAINDTIETSQEQTQPSSTSASDVTSSSGLDPSEENDATEQTTQYVPEVETESSTPSLQTQVVPPSLQQEATTNSPDRPEPPAQQFGDSPPAKRLAHLNAGDATEWDREVASRP